MPVLSLDHAIGARDARREARVRQARGAALRGIECRRWPLPAARVAALRSAWCPRRCGSRAPATTTPASVPRLRCATRRESAGRASPRRPVPLRRAETRRSARCRRCEACTAARSAVPCATVSLSFSSSCCAASRFPSVRSTMNCSAASSSLRPCARGARAQPLRQARELDRPDRQPCARVLECLDPRRTRLLALQLAGEHQVDIVGAGARRAARRWRWRRRRPVCRKAGAAR